MKIRIFDLTTLRRLRQWTAHTDYIRDVAVHATRPLLLSASDDTTVRAWDLDTGAALGTFAAHEHYVMRLEFSAAEEDLFASASLDGAVRLWRVVKTGDLAEPVVSFVGHEKGVNCVCFFGQRGLVSGGDDWFLAFKTYWEGCNGCYKSLGFWLFLEKIGGFCLFYDCFMFTEFLGD